MRAITSMMAQKKISTLQGTSLAWTNAIDCYLPAQEGYQLTAYGLSTQASTPTPDAPVAINGVAGNLVGCGKNRAGYNGQLPYVSPNGVTISYNNGLYNIVGTTTAYPYKSVFTFPTRGLPDGTYYLSSNLVSGGNPTPVVRLIDRTVSPVVTKATANQAFTISGGHNALELEIACIPNTYNCTISIQIESGSSATSYAPYTGQSFALPTLHGILSTSANYNLQVGANYYVTDTVEPEVITGGVHKKRLITRIYCLVLDGNTRKFAKNDVRPNSYLYYITTASFAQRAYLPGLCTHFSHISSVYPNTPDLAGRFKSDAAGGSAIFFGMYGLVSGDNSTLSNADEANAWLAAEYAAGRPVTVYYALATPVTTLSDPIPVRAWRGVTNVYTTSEVQGQIKATALVPRN